MPAVPGKKAALVIWQSGPDVAFWRDLGLGMVLGMAAVWAYKSLTRAASFISGHLPG
jgi:uncharacterized membrane protein (Fun14 family)